MSHQVDAGLLEILVCPQCKGALELLEKDGDHEALRCGACALSYPIEKGIPVMLVEEAQTWTPTSAATNSRGGVPA